MLLSGRGEQGAQRAERLVQSSGADWTIVRAAVFAQNFTEGAFAGSVADGVLPMPVADIAEPFIDVDDIADVATAALLDDRHVGQLYEVTGPRLLTFTEALERARHARPAGTSRSTPDEMIAGLVAEGMPTDEADASSSRCSRRSSTAATGRSPTASSGPSAVRPATSPSCVEGVA